MSDVGNVDVGGKDAQLDGADEGQNESREKGEQRHDGESAKATVAHEHKELSQAKGFGVPQGAPQSEAGFSNEEEGDLER